MTHFQHQDVDLCELIGEPNAFGNTGSTALLTPDSDRDVAGRWSDYPTGTPWCATGDDLDNDEAYFLEDDDDDDEDIDDDYDDDDLDDDDFDTDSDDNSDDTDL